MSSPRYRTLDGDEIPFPLAMDRWVLVPRGLARFDPELAWALDYEDAPEPDDADPRLDFAMGALLVPVERWNEHAELEPNLAPCSSSVADRLVVPSGPRSRDAPIGALAIEDAEEPRLAVTFARAGERVLTIAVAALAVAYVIGVVAWLWGLQDGVTGPKVSTGVTLVGVAVLLAWLVGVTGTRSAAAPSAPAHATSDRRRRPDG